jgi:hypothetical protein
MCLTMKVTCLHDLNLSLIQEGHSKHVYYIKYYDTIMVIIQMALSLKFV